MMKNYKFIVSGGGTGGHIFPALSIAKELQSRYQGAEILFVGAEGRMEMERVPKEGFPILGLPVKGLDRKHLWKNISVGFDFLKSLIMVHKTLRDFRPDAVIGVGGYASGPTLYMAQKMGIPTLIQEQNSYAGVANKWLAKRAKSICVAYPNMERFFPKDRIVLTGNPIRKELINQQETDLNEALEYFSLNGKKPTILLVGGSLGAGTLNNSVVRSFAKLKESGVQLLWQCGRYYFEEMRRFMEENPCENIHLMPFISRMDYAYKVADVIISRAGAGALSELCLVGKAVIIVPSPNVAEDHQTHNALSIVDRGGGLMVKDSEAQEKLFEVVFQLLEDRDKRKLLGENILKLGLPDATADIVNQIDKILLQK